MAWSGHRHATDLVNVASTGMRKGMCMKMGKSMKVVIGITVVKVIVVI